MSTDKFLYSPASTCAETKNEEQGIKYDSSKFRPSLVPVDSLIEIIKVLEFGAKKYAKDNWKLVKPHSRYLDAALRHIYAYQMGEKTDEETGLSHLSHAATCLMFLIHFENNGEIDVWRNWYYYC